MIIGDHNLDGRYAVRVMRHERVHRVNGGNYPFHPGSIQDCIVQRWNGTDWVSTGATITVKDPFYRTFAFPTENFFVENYGDEWFTLGEYGLRREGVVVDHSNNLYTVKMYNSVASNCNGDETPIIVEACYAACDKTLTKGDRVWVHYHPEFYRWRIIPLCNRELIRFEILKQMDLGGYSTAIEVGTAPQYARIGNAFPIKDPFVNPGEWRFDPKGAVTPINNRGYYGWCTIPANPEIINGVPCREIVYMEQIAKSIRFKLTANMIPSNTGYEAEAAVEDWYLGRDPRISNLSNSQQRIVVYDTTRNFKRALKDAEGMARYNNREHRYEVVQCNHQAILLSSTLEAMCPSQSTGAVTGYEPMTFPPYGQKPKGLQSALNVHSLANGGAAHATLAWDESLEQWVILQVEHQPLDLVMTVGMGASSCQVDALVTKIKVASMTCGETEVSAVAIPAEEVTVISGVEVEHSQGSGGSGNDPPEAGTCRIRLDHKILCVLGSNAGVGSTYIDMEPSLVVKDVYLDGVCVGATVQVIYSICVDNEDDVTLFCGTTCDSGS
jgi:hypothetical protein